MRYSNSYRISQIKSEQFLSRIYLFNKMIVSLNNFETIFAADSHVWNQIHNNYKSSVDRKNIFKYIFSLTVYIYFMTMTNEVY